MTTKCEFCSEEIEPYEYQPGRYIGSIGKDIQCSGYGGRGSIYERYHRPSTEGTQPAVPKAEPLDLVDCPICGGSEMERHIYDREVARFLEENRPAESSVPQAAQPEREATCEMIDLFTGETMGRIHHQAPAPVAQVDAGKMAARIEALREIRDEFQGNCGAHCQEENACWLGRFEDVVNSLMEKPAVAQTELPPIPDEACQGCAWRSRTIQKLNHEIRRIAEVTPRDSGQSLVGSIASLTQRLQASEAREAELKAEIAKMQMDNVIDYKAACEQHAANYEALERSHKALLDAARTMVSPVEHRDGCLWKADRRMPCQCGYNQRINDALSNTRAAIIAAEKL